MNYMTRHMVARQAFRHEGRDLAPGDEFDPTEVDARYYERSGMADPAKEKPATTAAKRAAAAKAAAPQQANEPTKEAAGDADKPEGATAPEACE